MALITSDCGTLDHMKVRHCLSIAAPLALATKGSAFPLRSRRSRTCRICLEEEVREPGLSSKQDGPNHLGLRYNVLHTIIKWP